MPNPRGIRTPRFLRVLADGDASLWISPGEALARARLAGQAPREPSLLERLLRESTAGGRFRVSYDDLAGLLDRVPDMCLPIDLLMHTGPLCMAAKGDPRTHPLCVRNKRVVNRRALRRGASLVGRCDLGLTDIVEPVRLEDRVVGVLFGGAVLTDGNDAEARVEAFARAHRIAPERLLAPLGQVPRASHEEVAALRERLRTVAGVIVRLVEAAGTPLPGAPSAALSSIWSAGSTTLPAPLARALSRLRDACGDPIQLGALADELGVNADHLSRLFRRHLGRSFGEHVAQLRIERACRLLEAGVSATDVAHRTGFADQAHFTRVFKRIVGTTPKRYRGGV